MRFRTTHRLDQVLPPRSHQREHEKRRARFLRRALTVGLAVGGGTGLVWALSISGWIAIPYGVGLGLGLVALLRVSPDQERPLVGRLACAAVLMTSVGRVLTLAQAGIFATGWAAIIPLCAGGLIGKRDVLPWGFATAAAVVGTTGLIYADPGSHATLLPPLRVFLTHQLIGVAITTYLADAWMGLEQAVYDDLDASVRHTEQETERVHVLLDVVTVANISENFAEASQSTVELLVSRFPIRRAEIWLFEASGDGTTPTRIADCLTRDEAVLAGGQAPERLYPIRNGGTTIGELRLEGRLFDDLTTEMHHIFLAIASHMAQVALRERATDAQFKAARTDELTGLANRRGMLARLEEAIEGAKANDRRVGLLYVDLDGFKGVNDTFGHAGGDRVLKTIGRRLAHAVRASDAVGRTTDRGDHLSRLGGDEFCVVLDSIEEAEGAGIASRRIIEGVRRPIELDGHVIELDASIGIAIYPDDAKTCDELLRCADIAMYSAKMGDGQTLQRYSVADEERCSSFLLAQDLRRAVETDEIQFHLQPIFHGDSGELVAAEALARWEHPSQGWIPPSRFIPIAESTGLITQLGRAVLVGALAWLGEQEDELPADFRMCVNASARELQDPTFAQDVATLLADSPLSPSQLEIEVTESMLLVDRQEMWAHFAALAGLGVTFALDDFGTGYASLAMLKKLPLSRIKIDRSFIEGLPDDAEDEAIVNAVLAMGRSMNIPVLAEGVETVEQLDTLRERGCDEIQGFLLGRPVPPDEFLFRTRERRR